MNLRIRKVISLFILLQLTQILSASTLPAGFVYVKEIIPDIVVDLRYYNNDNFVGERIQGYESNKCIATKKAVEALKKVHDDLKKFGLGLLIFDAYRPQVAVDNFVSWAEDLNDEKMKAVYYPGVDKKNLFKEDYIADKSSHSRGSTFDLTIIYFDSKNKIRQLDMGTGFDLFDTKSWPADKRMTPQQRANRLLLQTLMTKYGFVPYPKEWWHFTLKEEPFPDTYFNFPVK